ncbi:uncharacterized protein C4orf3 homolog [Tupaia chinensis]|uniref:uncharacterized protein C4orf3 homolog n=1 Tax=Tupaia chinensis TaxID=246437 RepID=UPI0007041E2D|nr:uncharacterized protein C4orf3 homolog [Tupaia chinensis]
MERREMVGTVQDQRNQQNHDVQPQIVSNGPPKHSYCMDVWLFIIFHMLLFLFVYLLPR